MYRLFIAFLIATAINSSRAVAQTLPPGFTSTAITQDPSLSYATCLAFAPDGRIFIGLKAGDVRIWKPGEGLLSMPFHSFAVNQSGERGLIGMALDPNFETNGYLYAQYNPSEGTAQVVVRLSTSANDPDESNPSSEAILLSMDRQSGIHNAGCIRFGLDGKLYIAVGEKTTQSSQELDTLYGKILRINPDGTIPDDNPIQFDGVTGTPTGVFRAIWAIGFRNQFRFAIHPRTGRLFANDVSSFGDEEINDILPGRNYGYPNVQGTFDTTDFPDFTLPEYDYDRSGTAAFGNAILGGAFYSPDVCTFPPEYYEEYFFSDLSTHTFRMNVTTQAIGPIFGTNLDAVSDMNIDNVGRLWVLRLQDGLTRIEYTNPLPPVVVRQPETQQVCTNHEATFRVVVSGSMPISYQWQRDGQPINDGPGISGATTLELTVDVSNPANTGDYRCAIQNAHGNTISDIATFNAGPGGDNYDGSKITPFVDAVLSASQSPSDLCTYDFDGSGVVGLTDASGFIAALLSSS